tara:strand:+ start:24510 stop:25544 length:1035 start_codon:yes stop_codon:yes gene_type:complete
MKLSKLFVVFLLISSLPFVLAQEENTQHNLVLSLKDATNTAVDNVLMQVTIANKDSGDKRTISTFLRKNSFNLKLASGNYDITLLVDNLQTKGKDYYALYSVGLQKNTQEEVTLLPVGSIQGVVLDNLDNLVRQASLKVECDKEYGEITSLMTDKFGSFKGLYLPVGECKVIATFRSAVGSEIVTIEQGKSRDVAIKLNKSAIGSGGNSWVSIFLIIVVLSVLSLLIRFVLKKRHAMESELKEALTKSTPLKAEKVKEAPKEEGLSKRQEDILNTLNEREKEVVDHLLANKFESSQAKIRHTTGIPKTSLVRIFQLLERKKVLQIKKFGKLKKVKLTAWFLGDE